MTRFVDAVTNMLTQVEGGKTIEKVSCRGCCGIIVIKIEIAQYFIPKKVDIWFKQARQVTKETQNSSTLAGLSYEKQAQQECDGDHKSAGMNQVALHC